MKPETSCNTGVTQELRPLDGAEVDHVGGGALWLIPVVVTMAVATFLASQKKAQ